MKARPGREPSQDDYLELLRVAEVLDALNQVEGNVLQQRSQELVRAQPSAWRRAPSQHRPEAVCFTSDT